MLLNTSPCVVSPPPASAPEATATQVDSGVAPVAVALPVAEPLRGRALIARLEQLAQLELAQLAERQAVPASALPAPLASALASWAWDLGLSGEAAAALSEG